MNIYQITNTKTYIVADSTSAAVLLANKEHIYYLSSSEIRKLRRLPDDATDVIFQLEIDELVFKAKQLLNRKLTNTVHNRIALSEMITKLKQFDYEK